MAAIGGLTERHVASRGATIVINGHIARSRSDGHDEADLLLILTTRGLLWNVQSPSSRDLHRMARTIHGRTPRSRSDRTAIAARSSRDRGSFVVKSPPRSLDGGRWSINTTIDVRSWPDRGVIVARSWRNRRSLKVKLKLFHR